MEVDNSEALETHYREALDRDPDLDAARLGLAETLQEVAPQRRRQPWNLRSIWRATNPTRPRSQAPGATTSSSGDLESAIRRLDRALAIDARDPARSRGVPRSTSRAENRRKRSNASTAALEIDRFDTEALYSRGRIRAVLGDAAGGKQDLESFKRYTNDHAELLELRGLLMDKPQQQLAPLKVAAWMFAHGRDADGLGWAKAVLASDPDHAETNALLAEYYSKRPSDAGLANFYRLRTSPKRSTPQ